MPITSAAEFEAILTRITSKIDKELVERRVCPPLEEAKRRIVRAHSVARIPAKLRAEKAALLEAGAALRDEMSKDQELFDMTWDVIDYLDYHVGA